MLRTKSMRLRLRHAGCLVLWLLGGLVLLPVTGRAVPVPDLYAAEVPADATSGAALDAAFDLALREVLVKLTGRRTLAADAAASVGSAAPLVQRYQPLGGGRIRVQFDAPALRRRLDAANLPVWADDRPRVLVLLVPANPVSDSGLPGPAASDDAAVLAGAARRGLPAVMAGPGVATAGDPIAAGLADARRAGAEVLLVGRPVPASGIAAYRWTLVQGDDRTEWPGDAAEGPEGAADRLASRYATVASASQSLRLVVSGVRGFDAYGQVQAYLRGLGLVQAVDVQRVVGDEIVFSLTVRGDGARLREALKARPLLEPEVPAGGDALPVADAAAVNVQLPLATEPDLRYRIAGLP